MRAVLQHGIRDLRLGELPEPRPGPGEVLLRTRAVTVCGSDLHAWAEGSIGGVKWDGPFVPGHEVAATVEDPNGSAFRPGAPVTVDPSAPCQACDMCAMGNYHLCRHVRFLDLPPVHGAMQELFAWPATQVFPLPERLDLTEAPLIEPLTVAVHATELSAGLPGAVAAVVGCGAIGLLTLQMARLRGAETIFAADLIPERLAVAQSLGADAVFAAGKGDLTDRVLRATQGRGVDIAFEAAGPGEALQECIGMARPAGQVIVIGVPSAEEYVLSAPPLRRHELTLRFVRRQNGNFPEAISLVGEGRISLGPLLTHRFPPERAREAFALAERRGDGAIRVAVTF
jgi:L-iditol 2-dehydrogenase